MAAGFSWLRLGALQGYNDGFRADSSISVVAELSPDLADPDQFTEEDKQPVDEAAFKVRKHRVHPAQPLDIPAQSAFASTAYEEQNQPLDAVLL